MLKKGVYGWREEAQLAFEKLKKVMVTLPVYYLTFLNHLRTRLMHLGSVLALSFFKLDVQLLTSAVFYPLEIFLSLLMKGNSWL